MINSDSVRKSLKNAKGNKAIKNFTDDTNFHIIFGELKKKIPPKLLPSNKITTTKYNFITWAPLSLLMQFQRAANIYFLFISILTIQYFSPKSPVTMIGTFALVLIFTSLKELYEDLKRYRNDKEMNEKTAYILNQFTKEYEAKKWEDLRPGDIYRIIKDEYVAADTLIIRSSLSTGICFLDTVNLDGETNLKEKYCPPITKNFKKKDILNINGFIECEYPNEILEKWDSNLKMNKEDQIVCSVKQLILKGCQLKNTDFVEGIIVYTGHNTKIMKNSKSPRIKVSNLLKTMNYMLYTVFLFQFFLCIFYSIGYCIWQNKIGVNIQYIINYNSNDIKKSNSVDFSSYCIQVLTFYVAYSHLIPISLYVALEIVKIIQTLFIFYDKKIFDIVGKKPSEAKTSDLIEELGQIEFIFSDKTGTLTRNEMEFKKFSVNFKVFSNDSSLVKYPLENLKLNDNYLKNNQLLNINSDNPLKKIIDEDFNKLSDFFTICSVCHSAFVDESKNEIQYQSSSPDEIALILGAKNFGYEFLRKTSDSIEIITPAKVKQIWNLILELPFDSVRKRMSVIVKKSDEKEYILMTKGADTGMLPRLDTQKHITLIKNELKNFSIEGLRTLVMAKKKLKESDVHKICEEYNKISLSNDPKKETKLIEFFNEIEKDLNYIGCSAIEDKLQEGVPETIEFIMNAEIKLWVLTGDKKETAIEIGKSCNLILSPELMETIDLASDSEKCDDLDTFISKLKHAHNQHCFDLKQTKKIFIIIDGHNLAFALNDEYLSKQLFEIGLKANSVICCRVSPKQKSQIVQLAKNSGKWVTLAIGDGANDVPMIMEGHIGVGIIGKEGTQAVRSSDYAIGQFRFLKRLLFVHGKNGYRRISYFICYYFYKNIILVFTEFYFPFWNGFSGQIFFLDILPTLYNFFWTSWPCIFCYSLEKDINDNISLKLPILYKAGQIGFYFNLKVFWTWIINALFHGCLVYFGVTFGNLYFTSNSGIIKDHSFNSTICFTCIIHIVNYKIFIDSMNWNLFSIIVSSSSVIFYYICLMIINVPAVSFSISSYDSVMKLIDILSYGKNWVIIAFLPFLAILPDLTNKFLRYNYYPNVNEIIYNNFLHYEMLYEPSLRIFETEDPIDIKFKKIQKKKKRRNVSSVNKFIGEIKTVIRKY